MNGKYGRYNVEEIEAFQDYVYQKIGKFETVAHEIESDDIHVDIIVVEPSVDRDHYTLVTMGLGAEPMKLEDGTTSRVELFIKLPWNWIITDKAGKWKKERWWWPMRWLKEVARIPIQNDTFIAHGHTVESNHRRRMPDTAYCGVILRRSDDYTWEYPGDKTPVEFLEMIPITGELIDRKLEEGSDHLLQWLRSIKYDYVGYLASLIP